jgi:hypothetical protein
MIRRFIGITAATVDGKSVNAETIRWSGSSSGYATTGGSKVFIRGLAAAGTDMAGPGVDEKVFAIWMNDTKTWELIGGGGVSGGYIAATGATPIAARVGSTPGSGTVTLYEITDAGVLAATTETVTAYNIAKVAVSASAFIQLKREGKSGKFIIDFEDC